MVWFLHELSLLDGPSYYKRRSPPSVPPKPSIKMPISCLLLLVNWVPLIGALRDVDILPPYDPSKTDIDDLLHGEHFNDILYSNQDTANIDALLVLYSDHCKQKTELLQLDYVRRDVMGSSFLALLRHDYKAMRHSVWFDISHESYDLAQRYGARITSNCPCLVFIKRGETKDTVHTCRSGITSLEMLKDWIWSEISFIIYIINKHNAPLKISFFGKGPQLQSLFLPLNSAAKAKVYLSYTVFAHTLEDGDFLNAWIIRNNDTIEVTRSFNTNINEISWGMNTRIQIEEAEDGLRLLHESHARRHYNILTQPPRVHNFTALGFTKTRIPTSVYIELVRIYKSQQDLLEDEYYPTYYSFWNLDEVNIQQTTLSAADAARFADQLRPELEKWCQCYLMATAGEGIVTRIRKYPTLSRVRMHVDELESGHVIGAILHIERELGGEDNWPLEVIDFQGHHHKITMDPGEMVLFEASKLVHGRPSVFKGLSYVNCFFYFMPREGWHDGQFNAPSRTDSQPQIPTVTDEKLEL